MSIVPQLKFFKAPNMIHNQIHFYLLESFKNKQIKQKRKRSRFIYQHAIAYTSRD